nr:Crp/Fnr family transcriptional regulator [Sphingopyxis bauzanensis]
MKFRQQGLERCVRTFEKLDKMPFGNHKGARDLPGEIITPRHRDDRRQFPRSSMVRQQRVADVEQSAKIGRGRQHAHGTNEPLQKFPEQQEEMVSDAISTKGFWTSLAAKNGLSQDDLEALLSLPVRRRNLGAGASVARNNSPAKSCSFLLSGFAYASKLLRDGARQIVSVHVPGDFVTLSGVFEAPIVDEIRMLTPGTVASVAAGALHHVLASHPAIQTALWRQTAIDASIFSEWLAAIGRRDAQSRVAHLLCEFAVRLRAVGLTNGKAFDLPMTQAQLADATGLTAVHVNRVLNALRQTGLVATDKRTIAINDWPGLVALADFDSAYLGMD